MRVKGCGGDVGVLDGPEMVRGGDKVVFFFQAEDSIRDSVASRGLGMCIRGSLYT